MTLRKNILITGASSGLGEGMARQFEARGRNLALCARRTERLETVPAAWLFPAKGAGHLAVISSFSAIRGLPGTLTAYAASKAGISAFVDGTRIELKRKGIAVTDIRPGYIESEMNDRIGRNPLLAK